MALHEFIKFDQQTNRLYCKGEWTLPNVSKLRIYVKKLNLRKSDHIKIIGKEITKIDSAGAWLLVKGIESISGCQVEFKSDTFTEQQNKLFAMISKNKVDKSKSPEPVELTWVQKIGKFGLEQQREFKEYLNFIGKLYFDWMKIITHKSTWHWNAVISVINKSGAQALPIIALLSGMIGVVISYQMGNQLQKYGADIFIVDLLGLSVLREFGPLVAAIMVGGRTGSAFTAQIGIMNINQEVDALKTMGARPADLLLLPRILGLFIAVPLLTMWADVFGVFGGMLMAKSMLGISWFDFLQRFQQEVPVKTLFIGLLKAPVFALIIASVGCFEGMKVHGSAESVGVRTTKSVVLAIFFIIVFDAIVSVLLSRYNI